MISSFSGPADIQPFPLRLRTTARLLCNIIVPVSLIMNLYLSSKPNSKGAKRRPENSAQSAQTTARRQREAAAAKRQRATNTTDRTAYHLRTRRCCDAWRIFLRAHTRALSQNKTKKTYVRPHMHTHTHTRKHKHTATQKAYRHCLRKAENRQIKKCHLKTSIVNGMHSREKNSFLR